MNILINTILALLIGIVMIVITVYFASGIRKKQLKRLAKELNLELSEKKENKYILKYIFKGNYLGRNILIEDILPDFILDRDNFSLKVIFLSFRAVGAFMFQKSSTKRSIISVDNKIIYERTMGESSNKYAPKLNFSISKIKKILDNYINRGIMTNDKTSPILMVVYIIITILLILILIADLSQN